MLKLSRKVEECRPLADGRINIVSEVVNGMRVIKYYAWEKAFKAGALTRSLFSST
jgi:hypothetical protein